MFNEKTSPGDQFRGPFAQDSISARYLGAAQSTDRPRPLPIAEALKENRALLDEMHRMVIHLGNRLEPALRPPEVDKQADGATAETQAPGILSQIQSSNDRVRMACRYLTMLTNRLQF